MISIEIDEDADVGEVLRKLRTIDVWQITFDGGGRFEDADGNGIAGFRMVRRASATKRAVGDT